MKKTISLLTLVLGLFGAQAQADISSGTYWGLGYSKTDTDLAIASVGANGPTTINEKPSLDSFIFRGGYYLADYLAVEFHLGTSLSEESQTGARRAKAKSIVGAFVRGNLPLHQQNANLYILLGGSRVEIKLEEPPSAANLSGVTTITGTGFSYAFGIELYATTSTAMNLEYTRYLSEDNATINSLSIGFVKHFSLPTLF